jgi:hypothetical protein
LAVSQAWSDALRDHPVKADGILFPSRHELSVPSCAIFETAESELTWTRWGTLDEPHLAGELARLLAMEMSGWCGEKDVSRQLHFRRKRA